MKNLTIKKQKSFKKYTLIAFGLLLLIALALSIYVFALKGELFGFSVNKDDSSDSRVNTKPPTKEQKKAGQDTKKETTSQDSSKPGANPDQNSSNATPAPKGVVSLIITHANPNGSMLQVGTLIQQVLTTGTCTLSLTMPGASTITKQAGVQAQSSNSTCKGFDVELASGTWQLTVTFENETLKGSATQAVVIQ